MEKIKLVIWDLDETFWKGTLSEEGVEIIPENIELVKKLTDRGIINSIVSKNDFDKAKKKLIELNIWDYFVFPHIEWTPKGIAIKNIIDKCQLRDVNVLFLDDNHLNLNEAKFYNSNIHAKDPNFITEILDNKSFFGKNDENHSRLKQYKILEKKSIEKLDYDDNITFLESSNILVELKKNNELKPDIDRIEELIERTNQLNFTKNRIDKNEIEEIINNPDLESCLIRVVDNYGDYGIVGYYCYEKSNHQLVHFVFSCRILNLGVEQFIYSYLNFPNINIVPEVAIKLDLTTPSWVRLKDKNTEGERPNRDNLNGKKINVFFKGGCDLGQMLFYLTASGFNIKQETNYVSADNNYPIHQEHTQVIIDSYNNSLDKTFAIESGFIPFVDKKFYTTEIFNINYNCLVFSALMDYTQEIYKHKKNDLKLPEGGYYNVLTNTERHTEIYESLVKKRISFQEGFLEDFTNEFYHIGKISVSDFISNLNEIRQIIPKNIPIIFINGAEVCSDESIEYGSVSRHIEMNKALDVFIKDNENVYLLDVRKIVTKKSQTTNNIRHYTRTSYKDISIELLNILNSIFENKINLRLSKKLIVIGYYEEKKALVKRFLRKVMNKIKKV